MNTFSARNLDGVALLLLLFCAVSVQAQVNRSIDGSGNNIANPDWGAHDHTLVRWADACYGDSISSPGGADRISPRIISNQLFDQPDLVPDAMGLSDFCWVFGQFLDHDLSLTADGSEFSYIPVPVGDTLFDPFNTGNVFITMRRSAPVAGTGTSIANPREHANEITAFVDGSNVYGSTLSHAAWLRTFADGKLKTSPGNFLPYNTTDATADGVIDVTAPPMDNPVPFYTKFFVAGDVRVNENPLLATMHTIFMREHNRLCDVIAANSPGLSDEELYQAARKINGGFLQSIVFNEWLPAMGIELPMYRGYDPQVNPSISNEFGAAAFRMGHTLLSGEIRRLNADGSIHPDGHLPLRDAYFNPTALASVGQVEPYIKGMAEQTQQSFDAKVMDDIRNFLFGQPGRGGLDLAAINMNRGRERGLPDYNGMRVALGLSPVNVWSDVIADPATVATLENVYNSVDSADAWVGMLAEDAMSNNLFGPTVNQALVRQFTALRDGDRYFYLNDDALSSAQKSIISNTRLSDIIRRNTTVEIMQGNVFLSMPHSNVPVCSATNSTADLTVNVSTPSNVSLGGAELRLYGLDDQMPTTLTNASGTGEFQALGTCDDYFIDAIPNTDPSAGVTAFDIYLLGQHILGITPITDPLTLLAADVNQSGGLSAFDMTNMRRVVLGLDDTFFGMPSWRTLNPNVMPAPGEDALSFDWEDHIELPLLGRDSTVEMLAVKMGDLNQSYALSPRLAPRTSTNLLITNNSDNILALELDVKDVVATQFDLELPDGLRLDELEGISRDEFYYDTDANSIKVLITEINGRTSIAMQLLVSTDNSDLTAQIKLNENAQNVAYDEHGNVSLIDLSSVSTSTEANTVDFYPNPLVEDSKLEINVPLGPTERPVFKAFDVLGRELLVKQVVSNVLVLSKNELPKGFNGQISWIVESNGIQLQSGILMVVD